MFDRIAASRLLPVVTLADPAHARPVLQALVAGGLAVVEFTLRTPAAVEAIRVARAEFPNVLVGAGTLTSPEEVRDARAAGAQFGAAAGTAEATVKAAQDAGLPFMPGIGGASDVERALALGCADVNFFPAELCGGVAMVQQLAGVYGHHKLRIVPSGGLMLESMNRYLAVPSVLAVAGSWMANPKQLAAGHWAAITDVVKMSVSKVRHNA